MKYFNEIIDKSIRVVNLNDSSINNPIFNYYHVKGKYIVGKKKLNYFYNMFYGGNEENEIMNYYNYLIKC
jgi:hypothetical protein